jgi:hypothetical protein
MTGHIPSWDHHGLPDGYAECIRCTQPITIEQLVSEPCPGRPEPIDRRAP